MTTEPVIHPLEDKGYTPRYQPVGGKPPAIVKLWGPRSQLRWFKRMWAEDKLHVTTQELADYHCHSVQHKGTCCISCEMEEYDTGWPLFDDYCCCVGAREAREASEA